MKFNKQKPFILGSLIVLVTSGLLFAICPMCDVWPSWWKVVYMGLIIGLSQVGWPFVQISHLSIIPEMTRTQKDRNQLSSLKNSTQFVAYIITFGVIHFILGADRASENEKTGPRDAYRFRVRIL